MPKNIMYKELEALADQYGKVPRWNSDMEDEGYLPPPKVQNYIEDRDAGRVAAGCPKPRTWRETIIRDEKIKRMLRETEKCERDVKRAANKKKREDAKKSAFQKMFEDAKAMVEAGSSLDDSVAAVSAAASKQQPIKSPSPTKPPQKKNALLQQRGSPNYPNRKTR